MPISPHQALDMLRSDDLIGLGMEADSVASGSIPATW